MNQLDKPRRRYLGGEYIDMPQVESPLGMNRVLRLGTAKYSKFLSDFISSPLYVDDASTGSALTVFGVRPNNDGFDGVGIQLLVPVGVYDRRLSDLMMDHTIDLTLPDDDSLELTVMRGNPNSSEQMHDFVDEFAPEPIRHSAGAILNFANLMAYYLND